MSRTRSLFLVLAALTLPALAQAQEGRSIALILDASGSMNARLPAGGTRLDAAKSAVSAFVDKLDPRVRLSYRAYGHQSPTKDKNCRDTELLVDFNAAGANKDAVLAKTRDIRAQGYTPITYVIELAAKDVGKEAGERAVVLVSDGKETCEGDPCAAAKALAAADARLVIHTIGFNVDAAARYQLQCIARVARGTYTDASGAADLGVSLGKVAVAKPVPPPAPPPAAKLPASKTSITISKPKPGKLQIKNADPGRGHRVTEVETGKEFPNMSSFRSIIEVPAGFYNVTFGPTVWKSIEVKAGETTTLDPGVLEIKNAAGSGHKVLDWETGVEIGNISSFATRLTVLPSTFTVIFGKAEWKNIEVKMGEHKVLNPAVIVVNGASGAGHHVYAEDGTQVANVSSFTHIVPVPPGKYTIDIEGEKIPLDLAEGQRMEINLK
jgi:Mg-chelatase subunit ChlD